MFAHTQECSGHGTPLSIVLLRTSLSILFSYGFANANH